MLLGDVPPLLLGHRHVRVDYAGPVEPHVAELSQYVLYLRSPPLPADPHAGDRVDGGDEAVRDVQDVHEVGVGERGMVRGDHAFGVAVERVEEVVSGLDVAHHPKIGAPDPEMLHDLLAEVPLSEAVHVYHDQGLALLVVQLAGYVRERMDRPARHGYGPPEMHLGKGYRGIAMPCEHGRYLHARPSVKWYLDVLQASSGRHVGKGA